MMQTPRNDLSNKLDDKEPSQLKIEKKPAKQKNEQHSLLLNNINSKYPPSK